MPKKIEQVIFLLRNFNDFRKAAANCLKRKKQYEAQLKKLTEQQMNIETMINKVQESILDKEVLDATILGGSTLSGIHKKQYDLLTVD